MNFTKFDIKLYYFLIFIFVFGALPTSYGELLVTNWYGQLQSCFEEEENIIFSGHGSPKRIEIMKNGVVINWYNPIVKDDGTFTTIPFNVQDITNLQPGTYIVRSSAGTSNFDYQRNCNDENNSFLKFNDAVLTTKGSTVSKTTFYPTDVLEVRFDITNVNYSPSNFYIEYKILDSNNQILTSKSKQILLEPQHRGTYLIDDKLISGGTGVGIKSDWMEPGKYKIVYYIWTNLTDNQSLLYQPPIKFTEFQVIEKQNSQLSPKSNYLQDSNNQKSGAENYMDAYLNQSSDKNSNNIVLILLVTIGVIVIVAVVYFIKIKPNKSVNKAKNKPQKTKPINTISTNTNSNNFKDTKIDEFRREIFLLIDSSNSISQISKKNSDEAKKYSDDSIQYQKLSNECMTKSQLIMEFSDESINNHNKTKDRIDEVRTYFGSISTADSLDELKTIKNNINQLIESAKNFSKLSEDAKNKAKNEFSVLIQLVEIIKNKDKNKKRKSNRGSTTENEISSSDDEILKILNSKDPYEILGITTSATEQEIKKRWRELRRKYDAVKDRENKSPQEIEKLENISMKINWARDEINGK